MATRIRLRTFETECRSSLKFTQVVDRINRGALVPVELPYGEALATPWSIVYIYDEDDKTCG